MIGCPIDRIRKIGFPEYPCVWRFVQSAFLHRNTWQQSVRGHSAANRGVQKYRLTGYDHYRNPWISSNHFHCKLDVACSLLTDEYAVRQATNEEMKAKVSKYNKTISFQLLCRGASDRKTRQNHIQGQLSRQQQREDIHLSSFLSPVTTLMLLIAWFIHRCVSVMFVFFGTMRMGLSGASRMNVD